jgi:hypothetical protein
MHRVRTCFRHIHEPVTNIRPILRRRFAEQCEHLPAVSPRCLELQKAHLSMTLAHFLCGAASVLRGYCTLRGALSAVEGSVGDTNATSA